MQFRNLLKPHGEFIFAPQFAGAGYESTVVGNEQERLKYAIQRNNFAASEEISGKAVVIPLNFLSDLELKKKKRRISPHNRPPAKRV